MSDSHPQASKGTILVVDDNPDLLDIVKIILEKSGYIIQTAYSGMEAFSRLEEQKPDLIILDIIMPQMDGLKVLQQLKGNSAYTSIPVILLTVKVQHEDVLEGYRLGADYYIFKPFTSTQLINGIYFLLNNDQDQSNQHKQLVEA